LARGKILTYVHGRTPEGHTLDERFYAQSRRDFFLAPVFLRPEYLPGPPPDQWVPFQVDFTPPAGLAAVTVSLGMYFTAGEVWFDDVALQRTETRGTKRN